MARVSQLVKYIEGLTITQGPLTGERMKVLPWQKKFLRGFLNNQLSALSMARALKSLVDSGMSLDEALLRTGFAEE